MAEPLCHYCDRPAEAECATCGRLYCAEHGEDVCLRCLAPESATPAAAVYRGSMVALGVASLVAIFLFLRPPEDHSRESPVRTIATATPAFQATATATPEGAGPTTGGSSPTAAATPGGETATPESTAEPSPTAGPAVYVVEPGDTLGGIAEQFGTTIEELLALNPEISDPGDITIGQEIRLPGGQ
jgi:LysM repeat protein